MKKIALATLINLFVFSIAIAASSNNSTHVFLQVYNCNNNNICEPQFGENYLSCPLECPAPPSTTTPPEPGGGGIAPYTGGGSSNKEFHLPNEIIPGSISVSITEHSATISWNTYGQSLGLLSWGKTADGELGTISEIKYGASHEIKLEDLTASTRYFFKIESRDLNNSSIFTSARSFVTLPSSASPINPSKFRFVITENGALLTWQNPTDNNFEEVRLLRSNSAYPKDPNEGQILYEGPGEAFLDTGILPGGNYYYALFSKNKDGSFSSGALLHLNLFSNGQAANPPTAGSGSQNPTGENKNISPSSINIEQGQKSILLDENNKAIVIPNYPITLSLLFEGTFTGVQSFILSVEDEENIGVYHSYLLRHSSNSSTFEANIPSFTKSGDFRFFIDILNANGNDPNHFAGYFEVKKASISRISEFWYELRSFFYNIWLSIKAFFHIRP